MVRQEDRNPSPPKMLPIVQSIRFSGRLARIREAVLNWVSGATPARVLNGAAAASAASPVGDLAGRLHTTLAELRTRVMDAGGKRVDYAALRDDPAFVAYRQTHLTALRRFDPGTLSPSSARAFWINLYNLLVLDAVLAFDIQTSVVEGILGHLTFFRRAAYHVGGHRVSLEDMEHGILRGNRGNPYLPGVHFATADPRLAWALPGDPRIHFALNCGSRSCPPIRAYTPERLDQQLDRAAGEYLETAVSLRAEKDTIALPKILQWFQSDFGGRAGVRQFLIEYLPGGDRRRQVLSDEEVRFAYDSYDWSLNESERMRSE